MEHCIAISNCEVLIDSLRYFYSSIRLKVAKADTLYRVLSVTVKEKREIERGSISGGRSWTTVSPAKRRQAGNVDDGGMATRLTRATDSSILSDWFTGKKPENASSHARRSKSNDCGGLHSKIKTLTSSRCYVIKEKHSKHFSE